jgi:Tfp pilus assembly protein PilF
LDKQGKHAEAVREMEAAISAGCAAAKIWNNLGLARRDAGDPAGAEKAFREALKSDEKHWIAAYNLSRLQYVHGDRAAALATLDDARERARKAGQSTAQIDALARQMKP